MKQAAQFNLITIGDSTIDTFIKIHDATVQCDINHEDCKICLRYGDKIPVDSIAHGVAGNAANVAVGVSKLGLKTAIYTNLGDDDHGETIKRALAKERVSCEYVKINLKTDSNLSVVLSFHNERTIFVYHQDWHYSLPNFAPSSWIYLTSISETFVKSKIINEILGYIDKTDAKLAFAPGTHQLKVGIRRYPKLLEKCQLLTVNLSEAKTILEIDQCELVDPRDLLSKLLFLGPKIVVITDGENGSYASDGQKNLKLGILNSHVAEKTGAGDAYSSGLISALFFEEPLEKAMVWGTINSSYVIQKIGAQNGLLSKEELLRIRKAHSRLTAVTF